MEFEVKTTYDPPALAAFQRASARTVSRTRSNITRLVYLAVGVVFLALSAGSLAGGGDQALSSVGILLGTVFVVMGLFYVEIRARQAGKHKNQKPTEILFTFEQEQMVVRNDRECERKPYREVFALVECREYLILFLNVHSGFILKKSGFCHGSVEEFRPFIEGKSGKKIQLCPI